MENREDERRRLEKVMRRVHAEWMGLNRQYDKLTSWQIGGLVLAVFALQGLWRDPPVNWLAQCSILVGIATTVVAAVRWVRVRDRVSTYSSRWEELTEQVRERGFDVSADGSVGYRMPEA